MSELDRQMNKARPDYFTVACSEQFFERDSLMSVTEDMSAESIKISSDAGT